MVCHKAAVMRAVWFSMRQGRHLGGSSVFLFQSVLQGRSPPLLHNTGILLRQLQLTTYRDVVVSDLGDLGAHPHARMHAYA